MARHDILIANNSFWGAGETAFYWDLSTFGNGFPGFSRKMVLVKLREIWHNTAALWLLWSKTRIDFKVNPVLKVRFVRKLSQFPVGASDAVKNSQHLILSALVTE